MLAPAIPRPADGRVASALTPRVPRTSMRRTMMSPPYRVAFLGFTDFERGALGSYFRLAQDRHPHYEQVQMLTDAHFLVADADHAPSVQLVAATDRLAETVFIGSHAPAGAAAWMTRPIDALNVMRELDAMAAQQAPQQADTIAEPMEDLRLRQSPTAIERPPAAKPAAPPAPTPETPPAPSSASTPTRPRALVVDDSEVAQRFLETRLIPWGLAVDRAGNSRQAADQMRRHSYELVFVDVELGPASDLDGLALCRQIKRSAADVNTAVVLVSAHHSELDRVRGALAGCDGYLAKPLDAEELERVLQRQGLGAVGKRRKSGSGRTSPPAEPRT